MTKKCVRNGTRIPRRGFLARSRYWLLVAGLIGQTLLGCQKYGNTDPTKETQPLDKVALSLKSQIDANAKRNAFYQKVISTFGSPHWDQALSAKNGNGNLCLVPFSFDGQQKISAILVCEAGADFRMKIVEPDNLLAFSPGKEREQVQRTIQLFDLLLWQKKPVTKEGLQFRAPITPPAANPINARSAWAVTSCYEWIACTGDGNGNCIGNITYHYECVTEVFWTDEYDYLDNVASVNTDDGLGGPGGGSGGALNEDPNVLQAPLLPISNVDQYLSCFDEKKPGTITLYADQSFPGSDEPFTILGKMGHVFLGLEQQINGNVIRRAVGFHPASSVNPFNNTSAPSILGNDEGRTYDIKLTIQLTADQMQNVLGAIYQYQGTYDLEKYNCVDFVLDVAQAGGKTLPRTSGWWIFGQGRNPGSFGEDLRKQSDAVSQTGTALSNTGDCQ